MPLHKLSDLIDEWYPPGTPERREHDRRTRKARRRMRLTSRIYSILLRIPPSKPTVTDEYGQWNWVGVGPVVAQFWHDILDPILEAFDDRNEAGGRRFEPGSIFYNALDGLSWRFFDDAYVPTWQDLRRGKAGKKRFVWRMRHRGMVEQAGAILADLRDEGLIA